jgi:large subunit ribosomal protein L35
LRRFAGNHARLERRRSPETGPAAAGRAAGRLLYLAVAMPKMKTHSGAKKRFRQTGSGKLRARHAFSTHILEKKSPKRKRHFAQPVEVAPSDRKRVRRLLGGGSG